MSDGASDGAAKLAACPLGAPDPFTLGVVTVDREQLFIDVTTSGCAKHTFSVCWDGGIFDSAPGQIILPITHDAHGDTCSTQQTLLLQVDLSPAFAKFRPPWIARVEMSNDVSTYSAVYVPGP